MVVLAATICTKAGKILVSRQFTAITKFTLEEYIKSFPKLIQSSQQHTYVETDTARYIYLPIETMYLVLITYKSSNIIEDLETIRLLQKVIVDVCSHGTSETNIVKHAFDILLAFDDVIAFGYRESVNIAQVQTYLSMESSEEKLHMMLLKAKQNEAAEAAKKHQREMMKKPGAGGPKIPGNSFSSDSTSSTAKPEREVVINEKPLSEEVKLDSGANIKATSTSTKKGLQLGKPKKEPVVATQTKKETTTQQKAQQEEIDRQIIEEEKSRAKAEYNPLQAPVLVEVDEKLKCDMHRDGALTSFEVIGDVFITVRDPSKGMSGVAIEHESTNKAFKLSLHPSLNKAAWSQKNLLVSKESDQSFPIGAKVPTIKYRFASTNINDVPFNFTYWYSDEGSLTLEAEFNSSQDRIKQLSKLSFVISYPAYETPNVKVIENGDFEVDSKKSYLTWTITELSEGNPNANIEIQFSKKTKVDDLFPIRIDFSTPTPFYHIKSPGAVSLADQSRLVAEFVATLSADNWYIQ